MSEEEIPVHKQDQLALAIARGMSIYAWARQNDVPTSTAYKWANKPDVRRQVEDWRRGSLDHALGLLARHSVWAVKGMKTLGESAESESVQLRARRAILHDLMKISDFSNWEYRLAQLEEEQRARQAVANRQA
jgi:hypothetical protein